MEKKQNNQITPQVEQPAFDPKEFINFIDCVASPEIAARCIDRAMLYMVQYTINEGVANENHSEDYWYLRKMRHAILIGSNNINLD